VFFYVFDMMVLAGKDVREEAPDKRRKLLTKPMQKQIDAGQTGKGLFEKLQDSLKRLKFRA
jgi:ATP-dependent DNA ligase